MPKKILFESAVHQLAWAGRRLQERWQRRAPDSATQLAGWLGALRLDHPASGQLRIAWAAPTPGEHVVEYRGAKFFVRGDRAPAAAADDGVMEANARFFDDALRATLLRAGLFDEATLQRGFAAGTDHSSIEESFHDAWAASEDVAAINVRKRNEACTAPEMRHIRRALGELRGRELLDVGCGLGEASVYFALEGARVTATDLSPGMCDATQRLAQANGVALATHVSAAEDLRLGTRTFDVIYTGNTLHHADLTATLDRLLPHLRPDGVFVSWDPVAYNPLINLYRVIATRVRTPDEHPLRLRDVRAIQARFAESEVRWFWFGTLAVFVCMVAVQFRNPNRERFWKTVIDEADQWAWLYRPLERVDRAVLSVLPFLRPLCWNVVVIGRRPLVQPHA